MTLPLRFLLRALFLLNIGLLPILAQTVVNFNSTGDLGNQFNPSSTPAMTNVSGGGLGGTGSVSIGQPANGVETFKSSISNSGSYSVSAYLYNSFNDGLGGLGFASQATNQLGGGSSKIPADSIGVVFHGGGGSFTNDNIQTVTWGGGDLAQNQWFKFTLTVTAQGSNNFDLNILIENSDAAGLISGTRASQSVTGLSNASVGAAAQVYPYFMHSGDRFTALDNFSVSSIPEPSTYALWGGLIVGSISLILRRRRQG